MKIPKYHREGNLVYTIKDDGTNGVMINVNTQPRDTDREVEIAEYILTLLKKDYHQ